ncbi:MAG: 4-hydroxy-3-methylbut-2-enyl diphosphate reductase, partial [Candidatus Binatia bacterium]
REVRKYASQDYWIILVGHEYHDEIVGTAGEAPERIKIVGNVEEAQAVAIPDPEKLAVLTQTTLSMDDTREIIATLRRRFPRMVTPAKEDICYATQNRQDAVKALARSVDLVLVVGSANSENSNQLSRVARSQEIPAYLINDVHEIKPEWLDGVERVGITSGASVPDGLVQEVVAFFVSNGAEPGHISVAEEHIHFALPVEIATRS